MESGRFVQMFALGGALILAGEALPEALATYQPYKVPALATTQNLEAEGFERILKQGRNGTFSKAGWNHYGPGYFELDRNTGILSSSGGMGLFWYAAEEFGNFVLDLEFMSEVQNANSGVFVRVHRDSLRFVANDRWPRNYCLVSLPSPFLDCLDCSPCPH